MTRLPPNMRRTLGPLGGALLAAAFLGASEAPASAAGTAFVKAVSANWSGYAATRTTVSDKFERVSGAWTQPAGACKRGKTTYSAIWVGLGGFRHGSKALEQTGSEVDCTSFGHAVYSAWYELVPAGPVPLRLAVRAGDRLSASVAVRDGEVVMQVKNLTTGRTKTVLRRMDQPRPDLTSAEWIVEAPSACTTTSVCRTLPLTNFGTASFTDASATTAQGTRTPIAGTGYRVTDLELRDSASNAHDSHSRGREKPLSGADPSELLDGYSAFSVSWRALAHEKVARRAQEQDAPSPPAGGPPVGQVFRRAG